MRALLLAGLLLLSGLSGVRSARAQAPNTTPAWPDTARAANDAAGAIDPLERSASDAEQLAEHLADLAEHPLDVNSASAQALAQILGLSPFIAKNIAAFRAQYGPYASIEALRAVEGVTARVLADARPYLTTGSGEPADGEQKTTYPAAPALGKIVRDMRFDLMQRYTRRLNLGAGYTERPVLTPAGDTTLAAPYLGSPARLYTRLRARYRRRVSLALTLDKDPGERFTWDPPTQTYGYDHLSGHAALAHFGRLKTLVAGDFTAAFGQGAVLWGSSSFGKGRHPVQSIVRSGRGLAPYSSAEENRFFRGLAVTAYLTPALEASIFLSRRTLDATLVEPDTTLFPRGLPGRSLPTGAQVTSLAESGLHRTSSELSKKDALGETLYGGALEYAHDGFHIGAVGYHARFDDPIRPDTTRLFRRFDFSGQRTTAVSLYAQVFAGDYLFFGEAARAPGASVGGLGGVLASFSEAVEATMLVRHFPPDFMGLHGYAFGEGSGPSQNETGFYTGLRLKPAAAWTVKSYFDLYRFPWARFAVPRPSTGYDARVVLEHEPYRWLSWYVQGRSETREAGADVLDAAGRPLEGLIDETRQSVRLHLDYQFSDRLRLRSRIEGVRFFENGPHASQDGFGARPGTDFGLILYQDVRLRPVPPLRLDARLAFFDTDSYAARVYAYENDLLYAFSVPVLSGRGQRFYLLARYAPFEHLTLELKYAVTRFRGVDTIGSGYEEIDGNRRRDLRLQVRLQF